MTQNDSQSRTSNPSKDGIVQAERLGRFQAELFEKTQEINSHWLERLQSQATLAAEFATKMASTRSFPDAAAIYQEWASRQLKLTMENASYAISAGQALMELGSQLLKGEHKDKGSVEST
jgi:transketolase